jgi:hypothetical protein
MNGGVACDVPPAIPSFIQRAVSFTGCAPYQSLTGLTPRYTPHDASQPHLQYPPLPFIKTTRTTTTTTKKTNVSPEASVCFSH